MTLKTLFSTVMFIIVFAAGCFAQGSDKITPQDYIEANEFSHKFADRLIATKDIQPLISEFLVNDFIERNQADVDDALDSKVFKLLTKRERIQIASSGYNFLNITGLLICSQLSTSNKKKDLPPAVSKLIDGMDESIISKFESAVQEGNRAKVRFYLKKFLAQLSRVRQAANKIGAGRNKIWRDNIARLDATYHFYDPSSVNCEGDCYGFPKGTTIISVNVPCFKLSMARVNGSLRILALAFLLVD